MCSATATPPARSWRAAKPRWRSSRSALKPYSGVDVVGPLPDDLQLVTILSAGIGATGKEPETVKAFIAYMSSPEAIAVIRAKGLEPGKR
jgi:ABC-type molybdate transport system substrate-binding protein